MEFGGRQFTNRGTTENPIYDLSGDGSGGSFGDNVTRISGTIDKATAPRQSANQSSNALWYETLTNMLYLSDPLYDLSSFDINNPDLATSLDIRVHAAVKDTRPVDTLSYGSRSDGTSVFDLSLRISRYPRDLGSTTGQFFPVYIDSHGHNVGNQFEFEDVNNSNPAEYISVHSRFGNTPSVYEWSNYQHYFKGGTDKHTFLTATLGPHQTAWLEVYSLNGKLHLGMAANHANVYDWTDTMEYTVEIRPSEVSSGGTSGSSGGLGTPAYICNAYFTEIITSGSYRRKVTYYGGFRRLYSDLPEVDLATMLHYTTSTDQNAELTLMPVVSENPTSYTTPVPPEFIGDGSVINGTSGDWLYQYYTNQVTGSNGDTYTTNFTRDAAVNYFIVNDAGKFYLRRIALTSSYLTLYKVDDNWNPGP